MTRARMTQIMKLLQSGSGHSGADPVPAVRQGLNERNLRPISKVIDWDEQRRLFQELLRHSLE